MPALFIRRATSPALNADSARLATASAPLAAAARTAAGSDDGDAVSLDGFLTHGGS
jgi:hypothetical protein